MLPQDTVERVTSYIQHQATKSHGAILDLVRTNQERYLDVAAGLNDERVKMAPAGEGEWSVRDLVRHMISAERGVASLVHHLARGEPPPQSDVAGRGAGTQIAEDGRTFAALVDDLREANERMLQAVRDLPESPNLEAKAPHPFFGPLNCKEWAVFQRIHDEDHIQHAKKILDATGAELR